MLMTKPRKPGIRAMRECEEHGWMQDRGDRHQPRQPMPDRGSAVERFEREFASLFGLDRAVTT